LLLHIRILSPNPARRVNYSEYTPPPLSLFQPHPTSGVQGAASHTIMAFQPYDHIGCTGTTVTPSSSTSSEVSSKTRFVSGGNLFHAHTHVHKNIMCHMHQRTDTTKIDTLARNPSGLAIIGLLSSLKRGQILTDTRSPWGREKDTGC
jgi:hypothetical protein